MLIQIGRQAATRTAHGEQFTHHAQFVQMVISHYARLVESIEALSLRVVIAAGR